MPYRIDIPAPQDDALDVLVTLGALDVEQIEGRLAAILPDGVTPETAAARLRATEVIVSPAIGRDDGSVWVLRQRPVRIGDLVIAPADAPAHPGTLRIHDSGAFGTGLHQTTALCVEALPEAIEVTGPDRMLDVGVGSGVLALAALLRGVPNATGLDIAENVLRIARENARLNGLEARLELVHGGPDAVSGTWPLVVANVLAAPLIDMAPTLVRRIAHRGRLILSGIPETMEGDVDRTYRRLGMRSVGCTSRAGWSVVVLDAGW